MIERGRDACLNLLGKTFVLEQADNSVFSYGDSSDGIICFMGVSNQTFEKPNDTLQLDGDIGHWNYYVACEVKGTEIHILDSKIPQND